MHRYVCDDGRLCRGIGQPKLPERAAACRLLFMVYILYKKEDDRADHFLLGGFSQVICRARGAQRGGLLKPRKQLPGKSTLRVGEEKQQQNQDTYAKEPCRRAGSKERGWVRSPLRAHQKAQDVIDGRATLMCETWQRRSCCGSLGERERTPSPDLN